MSSAVVMASTGRISLRRDLFTATVTNSNLGYDSGLSVMENEGPCPERRRASS